MNNRTESRRLKFPCIITIFKKPGRACQDLLPLYNIFVADIHVYQLL